jgi:hypothetical protein
MLFISIAIVWLAAVALCFAVCAMARRGDTEERTERQASVGVRPASSRTGLVVWGKLPELKLRDRGLASRAGGGITAPHGSR